MLDIITIVIFLLGLFFFGVGVIGLLRLPDVYTRLHATTKCDTLGAGLVLLAVILNQGFTMASVKLALMILFIWFTNPTAAHIIAKAARSVGIPTATECAYIDKCKEEGVSS